VANTRSTSKKAKFGGKIVSWIAILFHFDGIERWVFFSFSFGARHRRHIFDTFPGSAYSIPD
jgi:hypothetical protein